MQHTKPGTLVKCRDCDFTETEDYFVLRDFGGHDDQGFKNLEWLCRPCETKYPKIDPRDWHMSAEEAEKEIACREWVTFTDGSTALMDRGMITGEFRPSMQEFMDTVTLQELVVTVSIFGMLFTLWIVS